MQNNRVFGHTPTNRQSEEPSRVHATEKMEANTTICMQPHLFFVLASLMEMQIEAKSLSIHACISLHEMFTNIIRA